MICLLFENKKVVEMVNAALDVLKLNDIVISSVEEDCISWMLVLAKKFAKSYVAKDAWLHEIPNEFFSLIKEKMEPAIRESCQQKLVSICF